MTAITTTAEELRGDHRSSSFLVGISIATRSIVNVFRVPGAFVPILIMPIFFLLSFSGSFSGLSGRGGIIPTDNMLNWVAPYAIVQGAAFAGMGTAFAVARDLEGGFYDRFLLAPSPRRALLFGPVLAALVRALIPVAIVLVVAYIGGARLTDAVGIVPLLLACEGVAAVSALWGLGVALRFKSQRSLGLVQVVIFAGMFLSSAQVPVARISGWVHPLARVNPVTNILRLAREGFLRTGVTWQDTYGGLVAIVVLCALLSWFSIRGLRKLVL